MPDSTSGLHSPNCVAQTTAQLSSEGRFRSVDRGRKKTKKKRGKVRETGREGRGGERRRKEEKSIGNGHCTTTNILSYISNRIIG